MPRLPIDYEQALIYRIVCRDVSVTQQYVGSTTNLKNRRSCHKKSCTNPKSKKYNRFVYRFIRDNGGFDNWEIVLIEKVVNCSDSPTLHKRERYWIEKLHADLNTKIPTRTSKEWRDENKGLIFEINKKYRELNQDKIIKYNEKRRELYAMKKLTRAST